MDLMMRRRGSFGSRRTCGALERGVHEGNDFGIVESVRAFEPNVTSHMASSEKAVLGGGSVNALKEAEASMAGITIEKMA